MTLLLSRRGALGLGFGLAALAAAGPAAALSEDEARSFVSGVVDEVVRMINSHASPEQQAADFRTLFEKRAAVPQVTAFVMGAAWRDMNDGQKATFQDAFLTYVSRVYVSLLDKYDGQKIEVGRATDFGRKGVLVVSTASGPGLEKPVSVEWLVSDRGGAGPQLVDITIEGVSMLQSQRQEFAAKLEKRGGDVDKLIADLAAG